MSLTSLLLSRYTAAIRMAGGSKRAASKSTESSAKKKKPAASKDQNAAAKKKTAVNGSQPAAAKKNKTETDWDGLDFNSVAKGKDGHP
jgi:hypothetical protein